MPSAEALTNAGNSECTGVAVRKRGLPVYFARFVALMGDNKILETALSAGGIGGVCEVLEGTRVCVAEMTTGGTQSCQRKEGVGSECQENGGMARSYRCGGATVSWTSGTNDMETPRRHAV